jgi:hypothetical protein
MSSFSRFECISMHAGNNVMSIFGSMKGQADAPKNPRAVAQAILDKLDAASIPMISETSCAAHSSLLCALFSSLKSNLISIVLYCLYPTNSPKDHEFLPQTLASLHALIEGIAVFHSVKARKLKNA